MSKLNVERAGVFAAHPKTDELHFTADGQAFFKLDHALAQAKWLKENNKGADTIDSVTRAEYDAWLAEQGEGGGEPEMFDVEVTQELLDENPELVAQGVQVGDTIQVPVDATQNTPAEIKADVKKAVANKTEKKKKK